MDFPIVGIGFTLDGLKALDVFLANLPADPGMAFVLVPHLDEEDGGGSGAGELLAGHARLNVLPVTEGLTVRPGQVYLAPSDRYVEIIQGALFLRMPEYANGLNAPIDFFLRSLAHDQGDRAIAVILSKKGADGILGMRAIRAGLGMAMVQEGGMAAPAGKPSNGMVSGQADFVLPAEQMPSQLLEFTRHSSLWTAEDDSGAKNGIPSAAAKIFSIVRARTGHDFSLYKKNTIYRRIQRRMHLHQMESAAEYVCCLEADETEVISLVNELLIHVTSFFRDPEAFEFLGHEVLCNYLAGKQDDEVRVWAPGCSTGEEAYSLAILLRECMDELQRDFSVQIFGTDIDAAAMEIARAAHYPLTIADDVTPDRLNRWFTQAKYYYKIRKEIRDMVIFAQQDVVKDTPFTRLDLICCRNLLIYLEPVLQKKLLATFNYALKPGGALFLGSSESIGGSIDLFTPVEPRLKIYRHKDAPFFRMQGKIPELPNMSGFKVKPFHQAEPERINTAQAVEKMLLESHPPCAVIDENNEIIYIHGRTGKYLEPALGEASMNILGMAREGLRSELRMAIRRAAHQQGGVRLEGLPVRENGGIASVNLTVQPIREPKALEGMMLVVFDEAPSAPEAAAGGQIVEALASDQGMAELERELKCTREQLYRTIEEIELSYEDAASANEELLAANEELQSTNEELETSKEELESLYEELVVVNNELQNKINELSNTNDDIRNLLDSTQIATVFLDPGLSIKRFTPPASRLFNLIPADVGRPLADLSSNLLDFDLVQEARGVLGKMDTVEKEVQTGDGHWYLMRLLPYRAENGLPAGVVVTFDGIDAQKQEAAKLRALNQELEQARLDLSAARDTLAIELEAMGRLHAINTRFVRRGDLQEVLEEIVEAAITITLADKGDLRLLEAESGRLKIRAHRGLGQNFLDYFDSAGEGHAACEAMQQGSRLIVEDVTLSPIFVNTPALQVLLEDGVRALQSTPLLNRSGRLLGMISTHYRAPHSPEERDLQFLDLLARHAADIIDRSQSEEAALRESKEDSHRLLSTLASISDAFYTVDAGWRLTYVNDKTGKWWQRRREDLLGTVLWDMFPGHEKTLDYQEHLRAMQERIPVQFETFSPGLLAWVETSVYPAADGGLSVYFRDITGRKLAEERITHQNAILAGINRIFREAMTCGTEAELGQTCLSVAEELTCSRIGFIGEIDTEEGFYDIALSNPGLDACLMAGKNGHRLPPAEFKIHGLYGRVLLEGKPFFTNDPSSHPDSAGLPDGHPPLQSFLGAPLVHDGRVIGMFGLGNREGGYRPEDLEVIEALSHAVVQVLLRKRTEDALQESEDRYRALSEKLRDVDLFRSEERFYKVFHNSPDMVAILSMEDNRFIEVNQGFLNAFGYGRQEVIGRTPVELGIWTEEKMQEEILKKLAEQGEIRNIEEERRTRSGKIITVIMSYAIVNLNDRVCRLVISKDISEKKRYEQEMARLDRLNLIGEIAAGIAHEIRNPMTVVRGYLQTLQIKEEFKNYRKRFNTMIEELDRANAIITEFLSLARNQATDLKIQGINSIVTDLLPLIQADAAKNQVAVCVDLSSVPDLDLDGKQIRQLILNLARNGIEAMAQRGVLTIETRATENEVVLCVKDQGKGIPPEALEKLGTPFFTTKDNGTGLGLPVCYRIAEGHNARIEVQTGVEGTTFTVLFKR